MSIRELALAYGNQLCRKFDPGSEHVSSENNNEIQTSYSYAFAGTGIGYSVHKVSIVHRKAGIVTLSVYFDKVSGSILKVLGIVGIRSSRSR